MHFSYIILIAAGMSLFFSFICATLRNSGEKVKDFLHSRVSAEDTEKRYNKYNRLKKWFFFIGIVLALIAVAVAIVPRLIEINAMG